MPISDENLQNAIQELEATSGGSLVKHLHKLQLTPTEGVLFIGLGGLGSQTINSLKGVYTKEYETTDRIRFLAIDTCDSDLDGLKIGHNSKGYLSADESFSLFDLSETELLTHVPRDQAIDSWIGDLAPVKIDSLGAKATRQIGRVMLCGCEKYKNLRNVIMTTVKSIGSRLPKTNATVHVFVIAGISGGTGSGTFVDVSYMVRDVLEQCKGQYQVMQWGVFYTPEAQRGITGISADPIKWKSLMRNGYAALKELDYFLSNGNQLQTSADIYSLRLPDKNTVSSNKPIFDPGHVFLVSGNDATSSCDDIVTSTAGALLDIFRPNTPGNGGVQSFLANASNMETHFNLWRNERVGKDDAGNEAPLGIDGAEFPASMNYQYLAQGYASVYFPRDEIMAYCANRAMEEVLSVWKDAGNVGQARVTNLLKEYQLDSVKSIMDSLLSYKGIEPGSFLIKSPAHKPDRTMFLLGRGRVENTWKSTRRAQELADDAVKALNTDDLLRDAARYLSSGLIAELSSENYVANYGPFACIAALTGYGRTQGACQLIQGMAARDLPNLRKDAAERAEAQRALMEEAARVYEADRTPTDAEEAQFLEACRDFSVARFRQGVLTAVMPGLLKGIHSELMAFNNKTFSTYVPVMEALTELLNRDSTILVGTEHTAEVDGNVRHETFGVDAFHLEENEAMRKRLEELFDGYVDNERVGSVARGFARMMFGQGYGGRWEGYAAKPDLLAQAVREAFEGFFEPFANDILEKFAVLAYCGDDGTLGTLTPQRLEQVWNAQDGTTDAALRDDAIQRAAETIADELLVGGAPLVELEAETQVGRMYRHHFVTLIQGMNRLNAAIETRLGDQVDVEYVDDTKKSVARCVTYMGPLALPLVRGASDWAKAYLDSEGSVATKAGRHLDERDQDWAKLLPEPLGYCANEYWVAQGRRDLVVPWPDEGHDRGLLDSIRDALGRGVAEGYVYRDGDGRFKLVSRVRERRGGSDVLGGFREAVRTALGRDPEASLADCLAVARDEIYALDFDETRLEFPSNGPLQARSAEVSGDPTRYSNLCLVVRSSMDLTRAVLGAEEEYFGSARRVPNGVLGVYNQERADAVSAIRYDERLPLFTDMLLLGMLEWRPGKRAGMGEWFYMDEADGKMERLCEFESLQKGFESELTLYLAFTKGMWSLTEEDLTWLQGVCAARRKAPGRISEAEAADLRAALSAVLGSDAMRPRRKMEELYGGLLKMVVNSEEREHYSVPKTVVDGADVFENISGFYTAIIDKIDSTSF